MSILSSAMANEFVSSHGQNLVDTAYLSPHNSCTGINTNAWSSYWNCWIYTSLPQISVTVSFRAFQIVNISVWRPSYTLILLKLNWVWIFFLFAFLTEVRNQGSSALQKIKWRVSPLMLQKEPPSLPSGASLSLTADGWWSHLANTPRLAAALGEEDIPLQQDTQHRLQSFNSSARYLSSLLCLSPINPCLTGMPCQNSSARPRVMAVLAGWYCLHLAGENARGYLPTWGVLGSPVWTAWFKKVRHFWNSFSCKLDDFLFSLCTGDHLLFHGSTHLF